MGVGLFVGDGVKLREGLSEVACELLVVVVDFENNVRVEVGVWLGAGIVDVFVAPVIGMSAKAVAITGCCDFMGGTKSAM